MADDLQNIRENGSATPAAASTKVRGPSKKEQLNKLYDLPAPLRTFPLPTFIPHNPLSLFHVLYAWLSQTMQRPSSHFEPQYFGWFSPDTRSVHITDSRSIRGLWEQGFYGKGSLSRSEPNWQKTEENRTGKDTKLTSEEARRKFRAQRQQMKWERARKEREAIGQKLAEEAQAAFGHDFTAGDKFASATAPLHVDVGALHSSRAEIRAPVGPPEILALPNSYTDVGTTIPARQRSEIQRSGFISNGFKSHVAKALSNRVYQAPTGPLQLLALPNSLGEYADQDMGTSPNSKDFSQDHPYSGSNGHASGNDSIRNGFAIKLKESTNERGMTVKKHLKLVETHSHEVSPDGVDANGSDGTMESGVAAPSTAHTNGFPVLSGPKRKKSVRFSPTVEKNTFIQSEPPSPEKAATIATSITTKVASEMLITDQEHLQLTLEEAFFLSYALGSLVVLDPIKISTISNKELFSLFRLSSYFPPPSKPHLSTDDPFLINYVVYHHFRSLGWVVRGGTKFSVDFMLYIRGPVFTHAEFAVLVLPSYSDPYWRSDVLLQSYVEEKEERKWSWLHCINRVITQVKKTLILVYVDIPKPLDEEEEKELGVDGILSRYKIREFAIKRWSANRMRD